MFPDARCSLVPLNDCTIGLPVVLSKLHTVMGFHNLVVVTTLLLCAVSGSSSDVSACVSEIVSCCSGAASLASPWLHGQLTIEYTAPNEAGSAVTRKMSCLLVKITGFLILK